MFSIRKTSFGVALAAAFIAMSGTAFALPYSNSVYLYYVDSTGFHWANQAQVANNCGPGGGHGMCANVFAQSSYPNTPLPVNVGGADAQLYAANGTLCKDSGFNYDDSPLYWVEAQTGDVTATCTGAQTFYAKGKTSTTIGGHTIVYYTATTAQVTRTQLAVRATANSVVVVPEQRNASGMTYGSALHSTSLASEPDLILASGPGNTSGYVKKTDLYLPAPTSLAQLKARAVPIARDIPLYAQDGTTVLGSFTVG